MLKLHGRADLSEFLDDLVVYRNLRPVDPRLPDLDDLRSGLGLVNIGLPRKTQTTYALVVAEMLRCAHRLGGGDGRLTSVVMVGDTEHNDGAAFRNLCHALDCPGAAFIGDETDEPPRLQAVAGEHNRTVYLANRWLQLEEIDLKLAEAGIEIGSGTAVVVDIDKTALGARGRNHLPIDAARMAAVRRTVTSLLGDGSDEALVLRAYDRLNRPRYHPFTTDNQDVLAYVCMLVGGRWIELEDLTDGITAGKFTNFGDLLSRVSAEVDLLPPPLRAVHCDVTAAVAAGDPTPFKQFRRAEFEETVARMGRVQDPSDVDAVLASEIAITHEVRTWALEWKARGALLLGLSDKPDEASLPTEALADKGYLPLHRTLTHVVGKED